MLHGLVMDHCLWDDVLPLLPDGFRYIRPVLPLGAHRIPMRPTADLSMYGLVRLVSSFLDELDLAEVTLVHSDWGGGLFLTALGLDDRVARHAVFRCETLDNFPPGLPGRLAAIAARIPGGLRIAGHQLRSPHLRHSPLMLGRMAKYPIRDDLATHWADALLANREIRRDLAKYAGQRLDRATLVRDTRALRRFNGSPLVVSAPENTLMPLRLAHALCALLPDTSELVEIPDAYVLTMLDQPASSAAALGAFLRA